MRKSVFSLLILVFFIISSTAGLTSCSRKPDAQITTFTSMNTYMTVKSYGKKAAAANKLVQDEIERLESILSTTIESSDVWKINNTNASEIQISAETAFLIEQGLYFYKNTDGAFNPALYPVIREWGFTTGDYKIPPEEKLLQLLDSTDFSAVKITDNSKIIRPVGLELDFGAIGKGYAGDCAIELLKQNKIESALLDFGGNIQVLGCKPDGSYWTVGIKNPWPDKIKGQEDLLPVVSIKIKNACMITSGGYERYFSGPDGHKFIHIFDSKTGCPVENNLASVTIICQSGLYGDALSTSLFVMGEEKAIDFWRQNPDFDFVIITNDQRIIYSASLDKSISLLFDFTSVQIIE